ncbi:MULTISPECIES: hypothetical protein [Actinokineospora]|uniref:Uncharacterized protein n=1 Tax=Actinokineospora fastidiosa TaxID=1816 RepID=A0A918LH62_9PSEU|nr:MULTISPECIES: hypothetical protein [Actinokineospora]UVS78737.1 hypothetical protein Actkin_02473 [Actinokineospora sp. UTMC 2448]GGS46645.1 hypothetical protein GCM10010171_47320 [Actinokineospora fastidiosa]
MTDVDVPARHDRPLALHELVYLEDGDEVTIGRPDTDSYAVFPVDGAAIVRRLAAGETPEQAQRWYEAEYGESTDMDHLIGALDELGFLRAPEESAGPVAPVRWRRLGAALFSPVAFALYAAVVCWAVVLAVVDPALAPSYRNLFFTDYFTVIEIVLIVAAVPQLVLHEGFHALAGRRLGLRSRLRFGRRLYFLVVETSLDGLVAVPRGKRYLPILAGMLADVLVLAGLIIAADLTRGADGGLSQVGRICLCVAYATTLRLVWQFFLYLRTDLYVLISTVLRCVDLHETAKRTMRNRVNRLLGRADRLLDESEWHPVDRRVARWYSWLMVGGYTVSLTTFAVAIGPAAYHLFSGAIGRFFATGAVPARELLDSVVFLVVTLGPLAVAGWLAVRERRRRARTRYRHVIA